MHQKWDKPSNWDKLLNRDIFSEISNKSGQINKSGHFSEMYYEHLDLSSRTRFVELVRFGFDTAKNEGPQFA